MSAAIEYVSGEPEYDEFRGRGWYVVDNDTGASDGPYVSRRDAEFAAGRPEDGGDDLTEARS